MKYVSSVKSSMKAGCSVKLGPKTLIVGPSESGKSTILQSIELAAMGTVSDTEGRNNVKSSTTLSRLFADKENMFASLLVSDTDSDFVGSAEWAMRKGDKEGTLKEPLHTTDVAFSFPFQETLARYTGSAAAIKEWGESVVWAGDVREEILKEALPLYRMKLASLTKKDMNPFTLSLFVEKEIKSFRSTLRGLKANCDRNAAKSGYPLEEDELEETQKELNELEENSLTDQIVITEERRNQFISSKSELEKERVDIRKELEDLKPPEQSGDRREQKIKERLKVFDVYLSSVKSDTCALCGEGTEDQIRERYLTLRTAYQEHEEDRKRKSVYDHKKSVLDTKYKNITTKIDQIDLLLKDAYVVLRDDREDRKKKIRTLRDKLAEHRINKEKWENIRADQKEIALLEAKILEYKSVLKETKRIASVLIEKRQARAREIFSTYLPAGEEVSIDFTNGCFIYSKEGKNYSAVSGAQENKMLMSLTCVKAEEDKNRVSVVVPKDRGWDPKALRATMEALTKSTVQVIIASTVDPGDVEGWTIVRLE